MKNSYFRSMRKDAAAHQRRLERMGLSSKDHPLFSKGQSYAYRCWSCAQSYEQDEITVAILPGGNDLESFLDTLRIAGIESIVLTGPAEREIVKLTELGCTAGEKCNVKGLLDPRSVVESPETIYIKGQRAYL